MKPAVQLTRVSSTCPSREMSCSMRWIGTRATNLSCPETVAAYKAADSPLLTAVNQTSSPAGVQASPSSYAHSPDRTVFF